MAACDYLTGECARDITLARQLGFTGVALPVLSAAGGFDLERWQQFRQPGPVSNRRVILVKGYQHTMGRALVALRALELCADVLQGYRIVIQLASSDVVIAAELTANKIGIPIETIPLQWHTNYAEVMQRYGNARIHIGLSISDGISQSLLEAMMMGAFPIQACTACADEWIEDGKSGLIVPPEDPQIVAGAIRRAITDDKLVDRAAEINDETVQQRLAYAVMKEKIINMYNSVHAAS
jgi:glycosyltransferase involved in cell wall biosynthesis